MAGRSQYSREEVEEILRRAAERTDAGSDGLHHEDLVAAAREAGIDVGAVEVAVGEVAARRTEQQWVATWDARRKRRFGSHLMTYLVVMAFLFLVNLLTGGVWWFLWPVAIWGMVVALHATRALPAPSPEQAEKVTRRERRRSEAARVREQRRAARDELRRKMLAARERRTGAEKEFERAVENGVAALLEAFAQRMEGSRRRDRRPVPDTEFNRYVAQRKGGLEAEARAASAAPERGPRVRVIADDESHAAADEEEDDASSDHAHRGRARR
jgi:hypothetical protein